LGENKTSLKCENKIHEKLKLKNQNEKEWHLFKRTMNKKYYKKKGQKISLE